MENSTKVRLEKLRYVDVEMDGQGTRLPAARGFVDAFRVRVPAVGRVQTKAVRLEEYGDIVEGIVLPSGDW